MLPLHYPVGKYKYILILYICSNRHIYVLGFGDGGGGGGGGEGGVYDDDGDDMGL